MKCDLRPLAAALLAGALPAVPPTPGDLSVVAVGHSLFSTLLIAFELTANLFSFANAEEAVNVSPARSARVSIVNNVFTGSYDSALRTSATTVEHHNSWSGFARNRPTGAGDTFTAPALTATALRLRRR